MWNVPGSGRALESVRAAQEYGLGRGLTVERKPTPPPRNGLEPEPPRLERTVCPQCGGITMEVVLGPGSAVQLKCAGCGTWVRRPRR